MGNECKLRNQLKHRNLASQQHHHTSQQRGKVTKGLSEEGACAENRKPLIQEISKWNIDRQEEKRGEQRSQEHVMGEKTGRISGAA